MPSRSLALAAVAAALPLAACAGPLDIGLATATPTHFVAHQLCSAVFISGLDPERYYRETLAKSVQPVGGLIRHRIDYATKSVTAHFAGGITSRAVYRGETGCVVDQGDLPPAPTYAGPRAAALLPPLAGPAVVAPPTPALAAALDHAFVENATGPKRYTHAVVVVHDGTVIAERYAPGYGPQTPIHGWSMTKTVTNALIGVLVRQGKLNVDQRAPIAAWSGPGDPRHAITVDNLLRMSSGLDVGDSLSISPKDAVSPSSTAIFAKPDVAGFIAKAPLKAAPGTAFTYANGNTLMLSSILRDAARQQEGGDAGTAVLRFMHRELFDKLGMEHPVFEQDARGLPIGASQMWATARDWARLGMLYLNDGVVGGERILPEGWVDYSARLTPGSDMYGYGAGLWTNRGGSSGAKNRPHMPADSYMARGVRGQYTIVIPSARLVIVRMGDAYTHYDDIEGVDRLVGEVLAATRG